jgi:putative GTP pyrophosphokinase
MNRQFYPDRQKLKEQYETMLPSYVAALETFQARLRAELCKIDAHFTIKYRVKTFDSYYGKLLKRKADEKRSGELIPIHDILGTREIGRAHV